MSDTLRLVPDPDPAEGGAPTAPAPARVASTLHDLMALVPEHPVPYAGDAVNLVYDARGPVGVTLSSDAKGFATMQVTADSAEVDRSMDLARRALVRSCGKDPEDPAALGQARAQIGAMAFADQVNALTRQRLFSLACLRTRVFPFLAPHYQPGEPSHPGKDFTFEVRFRLRPHSGLTSYELPAVALPERPAVTDEQIDQRLQEVMGGQVRWGDVPEEARGALEKLRGTVREQLEREGEGLYMGMVADACADALVERLQVQPTMLYVELLRDQMANQFAANVEAGGTKWEDFIADPFFNMDAFKAEVTEAAVASLRRGMVFDAVVEHEGLEITEDDVLAAVAPMARGHEREAAQAMLDGGQLAQLIEVTRRAKAGDWLATRALEAAEPAAAQTAEPADDAAPASDSAPDPVPAV